MAYELTEDTHTGCARMLALDLYGKFFDEE
jgi:hypothetical protein